MKFSQTILAWSCLAILPTMAVFAYDGSMAPDPGSYRQGSSANRDFGGDSRSSYSSSYDGVGADSRASAYVSGSSDGGWDQGGSGDDNQRAEWYSSDWYDDQLGGSWRGGQQRLAPPSAPVPPTSSDQYGAADDDPGYGWREYGSPSQGVPATEQRHFDRRWNEDLRYRDEGYGSAHRDQWMPPVQRPRYRFRDDPDLEHRGVAGNDGGFRFRPLTDKELERRRDSAEGDPFPRSRRDQRRDSNSRSGEAFGYEPDVMPGSFYDRYYGGGR